MDTGYRTYTPGDRVATAHGVGTVKDFEPDGLGGWVTVLLDKGCVHFFGGAQVRPLLSYGPKAGR